MKKILALVIAFAVVTGVGGTAFAAADTGVCNAAGGCVKDASTIVLANGTTTLTVTGDEIDEGQAATVSASLVSPVAGDTYVVTFAWGDGSAPEVVAAPYQAIHEYGDDGTYQVTVTVTDADGATAEAIALVIVNNVAPTLSLNEVDAVALQGGTVFLGRVGLPQDHSASAADPGSDDLTFFWNSGSVETAFNNGVSTDSELSPGGTYPFTGSSTSQYSYVDPGLYDIAVIVEDDEGATDAASLRKLVVGDCDCLESLNFWRSQFDPVQIAGGSTSIPEGELLALLSIVSFGSWALNPVTLEDANAIFSVAMPGDGQNGSKPGKDTRSGRNDASATATGGKAKKKKKYDTKAHSVSNSASMLPNVSNFGEMALAQTLAAWLNFAKGSVGWGELIDINRDSVGDMTFGELIVEVETLLVDPNATAADLERAASLAAAVNLQDSVNPGGGAGGDDGSVTGSKPDTRDGDDGSRDGSGDGRDRGHKKDKKEHKEARRAMRAR